jgi:hypothetical protein
MPTLRTQPYFIFFKYSLITRMTVAYRTLISKSDSNADKIFFKTSIIYSSSVINCLHYDLKTTTIVQSSAINLRHEIKNELRP